MASTPSLPPVSPPPSPSTATVAPEPVPELDPAAWLRTVVDAELETAAWASHAQFSSYDPITGFAPALGWRPYYPQQILTCASRVGGIGLVGDSHTRFIANSIFRMLGAPEVPKAAGLPAGLKEARERAVVSVPVHAAMHDLLWPEQLTAAQEAGILRDDLAAAPAVLSFAFTTALSRAAAVAESLVSNATAPVQTLVINSGVWDLVDEDWAGGVPAKHFIAHLSRRIAIFLRDMRTRVVPAMRRRLCTLPLPVGAGRHARVPVPCPAPTLIWRTINQNCANPEEEAPGNTPGRRALLNSLMRKLLEAWNAEAPAAGLPLWRVFDSDAILPLHMAQARLPPLCDPADVHHPSPRSVQAFVTGLVSEICEPRWSARAFERLAEEHV